jgi:anti-anti-sigma factor
MVQKSINVERSGGWMPIEELREAALAALGEGCNLTLNLANLDHLDTSALQVLLAFQREQNKSGHSLELENVRPALRDWFGYAGAAKLFLCISSKD